ncbi:MAG: zinc ribbon domain-containing protein, partial [bacterium]|nr:zinc ribbon domain-containing protein [bacterium]
VYIGLAVHKGAAYPGEHGAIVSQPLWDKVQSILRESPRVRACHARAATPALLKGLLFGPTGRAMSPTHTRRSGKLYRYYVCQAALKGEVTDALIRRVSAAAIEAAVIDQLRALLKSPEVVMATWRAAKAEGGGFSEATVRESLDRLDPLWDELFPAEQARIVQLLAQRIDLKPDGLELRLRTQGLGHVVQELGTSRRAA